MSTDHSPHSPSNGQPPGAAARAAGSEIRNLSPNDLRALPALPMTSVQAVRDAVRRAKDAQIAWAEMPLGDRVAALTRAAKRMLRDRDEVIALAREEVGKCDAEGIFNEALGPLDSVSSWAKIVK